MPPLSGQDFKNIHKKSGEVRMMNNSKSGTGLMVKAGLVGLALTVAATSALAQRGSMAETGKPAAHAGQQPVNNLPNPYETQRNFGSLPDGRTWGSVSAVDIDVDGVHVWAGDRCGTNSCATTPDINPIVKLDPNGRVVQQFGAGQIVWPHGMDVDHEGNVWVADARVANEREIGQNPAAANIGNVVLKFSPDGELLMTIGTPGEMGDPPNRLTEPNDVLVAPNGRIYIAETHTAQFQSEPGPDAKSRVTMWEPDGTYIGSFGEFGWEDGQFRSPHSLAMDSQGRLFVADRGNNRIQIFTQDGEWLDTWYQFSRISGLHIDPSNDMLYAIDSESDPNYNPGGWRKGLRVGNARNGEVLYFIPEHVSAERASGMGGVGSMGEGVTADRDGNVYAGEVGPIQGMTKFVPRLIP
jgi:sugar lactone lactonase YvrE